MNNYIDKFNFLADYDPKQGGTMKEMMDMEEWFLRQHILWEFKICTERTTYSLGLITENNGHLKDITSYATVVISGFINYVYNNSVDTNKVENFTYKFNNNEYKTVTGEFINDPFLSNLTVIIRWTRGNIKTTSYYTPNENKEQEIILDVSAETLEDAIGQIRYKLGHEVIHSYESWWRNQDTNRDGSPKKQPKETMDAALDNRHYYNITDYMMRDLRVQQNSRFWKIGKTTIGEKLSEFLYLTDDSERNASIGQILQELEAVRDQALIKGEQTGNFIPPIYNVDTAMDYIKKSDSYKNRKTVQALRKLFASFDNEEYQNIILRDYQEITQSNIKNYDEFMKMVNRRADDYIRQYDDRLYKNIHEYLVKYPNDVTKVTTWTDWNQREKMNEEFNHEAFMQQVKDEMSRLDETKR